MSITDELRKWAKRYKNSHDAWSGIGDDLDQIADFIDAEHEAKVSYWQDASYKDGYDEGFASADDWLGQHEDAMAEHGWVRGPLDADGKMWRSGDMSDSNWGVIEGIAYEDGRWLVSGHDTSAPWVPADSIRHYHAPTVEDVLREFADIVRKERVELATISESTIAEFAAKLRLAEGEGA